MAHVPVEEDFVQLNDLLLVFPAGAPVSSMYCFNVTINDDMLVEYDEDFLVSVSSADPAIISPNSTKRVTIVNNDCEFKHTVLATWLMF